MRRVEVTAPPVVEPQRNAFGTVAFDNRAQFDDAAYMRIQ